ncbi:cell division protein ZapA [Lewinella cohaerens]|uniref:cell division protein ZapA n=1 Tax=Lewinella cohaerens TaxID=70995 RepID=UPI00036D042C|nr:cell division protein ZapA [Lewinella cohaerens]
MTEENMIKITVIIAGRPYPLRIKAADEPAVRKIVKEVNDKITTFQSAYQGRDKQDGLSMTILTYAFDLYKLRQDKPLVNEPGIDSHLDTIDEILEQLL